MKYKSVDEIDTFSFRDATITRCNYSEKQGILVFELDGAIVRENNSANELYTDRYVSDMQIRFVEPEIEALLLEGHSYYDANDVLLEKVPDEPVDSSDYDKVLAGFAGSPIFFAGQPKDSITDDGRKCFQLIVDVEEESYVFSFYYDKVVAEWEHFMNKVQN